MKNKACYIMALTLLLVSCNDDFLEVTPENNFTFDSFYETEDHINRGVAGIYNRNRELHNRFQWRFGEMRSDNTSFQPRRNGINDIDEFLLTSGNQQILEYWRTCYAGISRANYVLFNIDNIVFNHEQTREYRKAEALFLRAWFYFNLVQLYGDVPLVTIVFDQPEDSGREEFTDRIPVEDVYELILEDTQFAIDVLPAQWDSQNIGRVSRGAALMLKAKMHMARREFPQAISLLEEMQTLGYQLLPNFESIFNPNNKNHAESVFEIQYSFAQLQPSNFLTRFVPFNSKGIYLNDLQVPQGEDTGQNQPTLDLIDLYADDDVRKSVTITFFDPVNDDPNYRPGVDDPAIVPWLSKYNYPLLDINSQDVNFPMFRYADALLMLAECYDEAGRGDPVALLEQIRTRALPDPNLSPEELSDITQTIKDERRRELAGENHRYFDLLRYGNLIEVMTEHGIRQEEEKADLLRDGAYSNIRLLLGIPFIEQDQFDIPQNEGW